ncbi:hypothetical protein O181_037169 [Austropuccinia psidii MF-1]|uniref:Uncharacterized protein n=1 Tax=Austropuccinia psidii MF-1 TaxID=1389203 RepID=A0A9Q3HC97_9BASI|nr:hypothetical protein [Austropuccinia psidii MF-1]
MYTSETLASKGTNQRTDNLCPEPEDLEQDTLDTVMDGETLRQIIPTLPFTSQLNRNLKPENWKDMDQFLQLHQPPGQISRQSSAIDFTSHHCQYKTLLQSRLACLRTRSALQMRLRHCPPISVLTTPYDFTTPPLPSLCLRSALLTCSQHHLSLHLCSALPTLLTILTLMECPPDMLQTLLTILTLVECTPDMLPTLLTILTLAEFPPNMLLTPLILTLV